MSIPTLTGPLDGKHCTVCGRKVGKNPWLVCTVDFDPVAQDDPRVQDGSDPSDTGCFPVGVECAKNFPDGYLSR